MLEEREVVFKSGGNNIYGTYLNPTKVMNKGEAVILISGSGPTDRDGNSTLIYEKLDTLKIIANDLGEAGIASLRYDKIGTGKTNLGNFESKVETITFETFVETVKNAFLFFSHFSKVDPQRISLFGHSEGCLIAMTAATQLPMPPASLILAAPLSLTYVETIKKQAFEQYKKAVSLNQITQEYATETLQKLDYIVAQIINNSNLSPCKIESPWNKLFVNSNINFLRTANQYDPLTITKNLRGVANVLVICGQEDELISCSDVSNLVNSFRNSGNFNVSFVELKNIDHTLRENKLLRVESNIRIYSKEISWIIIEFLKKLYK